MIVYHGSFVEVRDPDVSLSRDNVDFGKGFYTTPLKAQAVKWAKRFKAKKYDVIIGGVANDKVFNTVELFLDGLIEKSAALERLRYEKPNPQICFCSQEAIVQCVHFVKSEVV